MTPGQPRNHCRRFVEDHGGSSEWLAKADFDELARAGSFLLGPFRETFGDDYGDPYNPHKQAFGVLKDGRVVVCELSPNEGVET